MARIGFLPKTVTPQGCPSEVNASRREMAVRTEPTAEELDQPVEDLDGESIVIVEIGVDAVIGPLPRSEHFSSESLKKSSGNL